MSGSEDGQRKKRIAIIAVCSTLLVAMVVAVTVGISINDTSGNPNNGSKNSQVSSSMRAIKSICQPTDYKKTCVEQLHKEAGDTTDVKKLVQAAFKAAMKFASQAANSSITLRDLEKDPRSKKALDVCKQLMTYSINELQKSFDHIDKLDVNKFEKMLADIKIWLSATITNQQTCLDGFNNTASNAGQKMKKALNISMQLSKNGLAIAAEMAEALKQLQIESVSRRRLLQVAGNAENWNAFNLINPWSRRGQPHHRRLLQVVNNAENWNAFNLINPWSRRGLLNADDSAVDGHSEFEFDEVDENEKTESRRRLLQVVGNVENWNAFNLINPWSRRGLLNADDAAVDGHSEFEFDEVDENEKSESRRRLLQVVGNAENWNAFNLINPWSRRGLLNVDDTTVEGHSEFAFDEEELPETRRKLMARHPSRIKADIVVAKDGSGNFTTIKAAMGAIPLDATKPFVIYIKEGIYQENLEFGYRMTNVALIGDGKEKTRITGSLNNVDGVPTFRTATVAVNGDRFFAKNIGFENSAGAIKMQAVALMVISDFSVFYNCSMDGYQDTLYVHSKRQFYRDCTISGTIDFVFGDAAAVFQNCTFLIRTPLKGQQNIVTASGRTDVREPTGIVIQNSTFTAAPEFVPMKNQFPTYLGRPWGNFSKTIIMESYLDDVIKPEGWTIWDGEWGLKTCFYSEFNNHGPGSTMTHRATWPGIKKIRETTALDYTPGKFLDGDFWIKPRRVPYHAGLFQSNTMKPVKLKVQDSSITRTH